MTRLTGTARLAATIVSVMLVAGACSGDGESADTSVPATLTTTSQAATTTVAEVTTTVPETTTTTTVPETTTTTTMPETTTTLVDDPDAVTLSAGGVQAGTQWAPFGTDDEATITAISELLGEPTEDSGWIDSFSIYGTCPPPVVRGVHWRGLIALFTLSTTDFAPEGIPHFFSYYYSGEGGDGLETAEGLEVGSTVSQLVSLYGGPGFTFVEWEFDPEVGFWSTEQFDSEQLYGFTTGLDDSDTVTAINGGIGCGE